MRFIKIIIFGQNYSDHIHVQFLNFLLKLKLSEIGFATSNRLDKTILASN